jgi:hypothetical protein
MSRGRTIRVPENRVFHDAWNSAVVGLRGALPHLQRVLPDGWSAAEGPRASVRELSIVVRAPDGRAAHLRVISRHRFEPRDIAGALANCGHTAWSRWPLLVAAPFLSERTRTLLIRASANYVDATGNLRLGLPRPSIFVERTGAERDPARRKHGLLSLRGSTAGRVVHALRELAPPYRVRQLARQTGISAASVSRVLSVLEREAVVVRGARGEVIEIDREALLAQWAAGAPLAIRAAKPAAPYDR